MLAGRHCLLPQNSTSWLLLIAAAVSTPHVMCTTLTPASQGTLSFCAALPAAAAPPASPPWLPSPLPLVLLGAAAAGLALCRRLPAAPPHTKTCPSVLRAIEEAAAATCMQAGSPGTCTGNSLSCSSPVPSAPCPLYLRVWVCVCVPGNKSGRQTMQTGRLCTHIAPQVHPIHSNPGVANRSRSCHCHCRCCCSPVLTSTCGRGSRLTRMRTPCRLMSVPVCVLPRRPPG